MIHAISDLPSLDEPLPSIKEVPRFVRFGLVPGETRGFNALFSFLDKFGPFLHSNI